MEIIKLKQNEKEVNLETVEAVIFNKEDNQIISLDDLSFLTDISIISLKNYIRDKHILHYHISSKWFVGLKDFFDKGERVLR